MMHSNKTIRIKLKYDPALTKGPTAPRKENSEYQFHYKLRLSLASHCDISNVVCHGLFLKLMVVMTTKMCICMTVYVF